MNQKNHNKGMRFPVEVLTTEEVRALLDACSRRSMSGRRDRALICVLWRCQLRLSEALGLKPADFDPEKGQLRVLVGKGSKSRVVGIDDRASAELQTWLTIREKLGVNGHSPIFCCVKGERVGSRVSTSQVRQKLPRLAKKAGIVKRVHAHGLRHTGASELVEEGFSVLDIAQQLGHSNVATTNTYLHQINPKAMVEQLRKREW